MDPMFPEDRTLDVDNGARIVIVDIASMLSEPRAATGAYIGWAWCHAEHADPRRPER